MRQSVRDSLIASDKLRHIREAAGLSLSQAAALSGVARWRIQRIETGMAQPTFSDVIYLCAACGCRLEALLDEGGRAVLRAVLADSEAVSENTSSKFLVRLKKLIGRNKEIRLRVIDICWWYYRMRQSLNGLEIPALEVAGAEELYGHVVHACAMDAVVRGRLREMLELYSER